jgi:hypothetical protein
MDRVLIGGSKMWQKILWSYFAVWIAFQSAASADGSSNLMKGIKIIKYITGIEKTVGGNGCKIDQQNLNTSLEFLANQSTKLRIVTWDQQVKQTDDLRSKAESKAPSVSDFYKDLNKYQADLKEHQAAGKVELDYIYMPTLMISIDPLQIGNGCGGVINAKLSANVHPTKLIPTERDVYHETIEIWSDGFYFVSPQPTFSDYAINAAGQMMKKLVNDWAASQE